MLYFTTFLLGGKLWVKAKEKKRPILTIFFYLQIKRPLFPPPFFFSISSARQPSDLCVAVCVGLQQLVNINNINRAEDYAKDYALFDLLLSLFWPSIPLDCAYVRQKRTSSRNHVVFVVTCSSIQIIGRPLPMPMACFAIFVS